jgi:hypothetical protein
MKSNFWDSAQLFRVRFELNPKRSTSARFAYKSDFGCSAPIPGIGARLPTYRFTTRNSAMMAAWLVVIE